MSVYMTEAEQIEEIKKWWSKYGNIVTICLTVLLIMVAGYRYVHWHNDKLTQEASIAYENMMLSYSNENIKSVRAFANDLISQHSKTVYSDAAHLTLAKVYVEKAKYQQAIDELGIVASEGKMLQLKQIATIRIARIMASTKAYSDALKKLDVVQDNTYLPVINELRGDIYASKGEYKSALIAYKKAMDEVHNSGVGNVFLEMKTNELAMKANNASTQNNLMKTAQVNA